MLETRDGHDTPEVKGFAENRDLLRPRLAFDADEPVLGLLAAREARLTASGATSTAIEHLFPDTAATEVRLVADGSALEIAREVLNGADNRVIDLGPFGQAALRVESLEDRTTSIGTGRIKVELVSVCRG